MLKVWAVAGKYRLPVRLGTWQQCPDRGLWTKTNCPKLTQALHVPPLYQVFLFFSSSPPPP